MYKHIFLLPLMLLALQIHAQSVAAKEVVSIRLIQAVPGNIFYADEARQLTAECLADSITWSVTDHRGDVIKRAASKASHGLCVLNVDPGQNGWFRLDLKAWRNGVIFSSKETSFAVLSRFDLKTVDSSAFIGQTHHWQAIDTLIPIAARMGVKYVRDNIRWESVEKIKNTFNVSAKQEKHLDLLQKYHLLPYQILALYNPLYDRGASPVSPESITAFAAYCKYLLQRFPQIKEVEVWNEPDIPTFSKGLSGDQQKADFYFNLLKETYTQLHSLFPRVRFSGFAMSELASDALINSVLERGALNYLQSFSFHSYIPVPELIDAEIERQKKLLMKYTKSIPPLVLSETGYSTYNFTEQQQAAFLVRRIVAALSHGIGKVGIYNLQNKGVDGEKESEFGLIRHGLDEKGAYVPKPAFVAYANVTRQLTGFSFVKTEHTKDSLIYSYLFKRGAEERRVMFAAAGSDIQLYPSGPVTITDMMGAIRKLLPVSGKVRMYLSGEPVYVTGALTGRLFEESVSQKIRPLILEYGYYVGGYKEYPGIIDNPMLPDSVKKASWFGTAASKGMTAHVSRVLEKPTVDSRAVWLPVISIPGFYRVSVFIPGDPSGNAQPGGKVLYRVNRNADESDTVMIDQQVMRGQLVLLGTYYFSKGRTSSVELFDGGNGRYPLRADVLQLEMIPATQVSASADIFWMQPGETQLPAATILPLNATDRQVVWKSENVRIAEVDAKGLIKAIGEGETFVKAINPATGLFDSIRIIVTD